MKTAICMHITGFQALQNLVHTVHNSVFRRLFFQPLISVFLCRWAGKTWTMCKPQSSAPAGDVTSPPPPSESLLKTWLWRYKHAGSRLDKQRLLVVLLVMVALLVMVLLLMWNYQCLMVTRVCQNQEDGSEYVGFNADVRRTSFT